MNRNKKEKRKKDILRLKREWDDIHESIWNQNWVPLDKPIQKGWNITYEVREDIARSKAGRGISHAIDLSYKTAWSDREDGMVWCSCERKYKEVQIERYSINEYVYNNLPSYVKKYYHEEAYVSTWHGVWYSPIWLERWKLTRVITPNVLTHYQEHDELLYQMEAELQDELYSNKYRGEVWPGYSGQKFYNRHERKKNDRADKRKIKRTIVDYNGGDIDAGKEVMFSTNKCADYWW